MSAPIGHTPGPLRAYPVDPNDFSGMAAWGSAYTITGGEPNTVSEVFVGFTLRKDDAVLFAAAPDLLAALIEARHQMTNQRYLKPRIGMENACLLADIAIAKAEGRAG